MAAVKRKFAMPKSKEFISSESDSDSGSDVEPKPKKKKTEKPKPKMEVKVEKSPKKKEKGASGDSGATKGPNGELMWPIAKMRFVSVSEFRGKVMVGIREFYDKDGEMLPGRKGISLPLDQWKKLKGHMDEIEDAIKDMS